MKNEEFNKLDHLFKTKIYSELSEEERNWVDDVIGKNAYEELSLMITDVSNEMTREVNPAIKSDLMKAMKRKNRSVLASMLSYRTPMYVNAVLVAVVFAFTWFITPEREVIVERPVTVTIPVVDTVTIQLPPDTVLIEKQVRVEVPVYLTRTEIPEQEKKEVESKPFAEEQALQDLLVSGR